MLAAVSLNVFTFYSNKISVAIENFLWFGLIFFIFLNFCRHFELNAWKLILISKCSFLSIRANNRPSFSWWTDPNQICCVYEIRRFVTENVEHFYVKCLVELSKLLPISSRNQSHRPQNQLNKNMHFRQQHSYFDLYVNKWVVIFLFGFGEFLATTTTFRTIFFYRFVLFWWKCRIGNNCKLKYEDDFWRTFLDKPVNAIVNV